MIDRFEARDFIPVGSGSDWGIYDRKHSSRVFIKTPFSTERSAFDFARELNSLIPGYGK